MLKSLDYLVHVMMQHAVLEVNTING